MDNTSKALEENISEYIFEDILMFLKHLVYNVFINYTNKVLKVIYLHMRDRERERKERERVREKKNKTKQIKENRRVVRRHLRIL